MNNVVILDLRGHMVRVSPEHAVSLSDLFQEVCISLIPLYNALLRQNFERNDNRVLDEKTDLNLICKILQTFRYHAIIY